jgi:hypothetical protein
MRPILIALLVVASTACDLSKTNRPAETRIEVHLRDDQATPGGPNQVLVTPMMGTRINARTGADGVAEIPVQGAGVYEVRVIPRSGYLSLPELTKTVTVLENETVVVRFTLRMIGWTDDPIEPPAR